MDLEQDALSYHENPQPGKLEIRSTKPCVTSRDLSLAYSPGVAAPCLEIAEDQEKVYRYTSKGNLVGVISNGTAVLGLGDIGPHASKPVMEGKGVLFKTFADIDVFDIELDCNTVDSFVEAVRALAPTFGGINLEDIKAPECFEIEKQLIKKLDIPVFHDDQHGTAIIAAAALVNALEIVEKSIADVRLVVSGAGASALACCHLLVSLGLSKQNLMLCDSRGVIYQGREAGMNVYKEEYAVETNARSLADAMKGADVFFGLSRKDLVTPEMLRDMNENPIVFAMANPDPEIDYESAKAARSDVIFATGRSDYPNQVNNVLGFPFIFRGALDVRAKGINEEMKLAAVRGLAALAKEPVPESVRSAYGNADFSFGKEYLIPKPFDPRVLYYVAPAVAKAAMDSGLARVKLDIEDYTLKLKSKVNRGREILSRYYGLAKKATKKRVAFPEGGNPNVIRAAVMAQQEGVAEPILLGKTSVIQESAALLDLDISELQIIEPPLDPRYEKYAQEFYGFSNRRGINLTESYRKVRLENYFANMMLRSGDVEAVICGIDRYYPDMISPIFRTVGFKPGVTTAAGLYIVSANQGLFFFADTTINTEMDSEKLASVALLAANFAESMDVLPRVAMLSYSNFGSVARPEATMVREATELLKTRAPELQVDGEMQADTAVVSEILKEKYPFCELEGPANVLVFPDMQSGNISYKLLQRLGGARVVGPIILGLNRPAYVMQRHASVDEIFNMSIVAVVQSALS